MLNDDTATFLTLSFLCTDFAGEITTLYLPSIGALSKENVGKYSGNTVNLKLLNYQNSSQNQQYPQYSPPVDGLYRYAKHAKMI